MSPSTVLALAILIAGCGRINFEATAIDSGTRDGESQPDASLPRIITTGEPLLVPGTSNIYGAGHADPPAPSGGGAGVLPAMIRLPAGSGRSLVLTQVTGTVNIAGTDFGPDGSEVGFSFQEGPYGGLSAYWSTRNGALSLVFVDESEPIDPPPPALNSDNLSYISIAPQLNQIIAIGDGFTDSGTQQRIYVPDGATRGFLGVADSAGGSELPGSYGDNTGSFTFSGEFHLPPDS